MLDNRMFQRIQRARQAKNWKALRRCGETFLQSDREDIYGLQLVGESYEKTGEVDQALGCYENALSIDARLDQGSIGHTLFLQRLDILYNRANAYSDCLRVCRYYVARHPDSRDAWNRLGRAAKHVGDHDMASEAKRRAEAITQEREEARQRIEKRSTRFGELYEQELRKLGYDPDDEGLDSDEQPPSDDASDHEWGDWAGRTTDRDRIEAKIAAGLSATLALEWEDLERKLGPPRAMSPEARLALVEAALGRLPECAGGGFISFTDRSSRENWVQLTEQYCNISLRDWPDATPLSETQKEQLEEMGFLTLAGQDTMTDSLMDHTRMDRGMLARFVLQLFSLYGSAPDFELVVEFEDM
jgi:tetratricopeptide (TPR) repeat protein